MAESGAAATFPVVGLGASAGGLEALRQLFAHLPADSGIALVVIQHLDPDRPSMLTSVLGGVTRLPVVEVVSGMRADPDRVHVMPSGADLVLQQGVLTLVPRHKTGKLHLPIDSFFRALAKDQHSRAIGVVLSGSGADGSEGLRAIKAEGGIAIAQDPESAQFRSMPHSAIDSGVVDFRGTPEEIAKELARLSHHPYVAAARRVEGEPQQAGLEHDNSLPAIVALVQQRACIDFSGYKRSTVLRRIQRRMALRHVSLLSDYANMLRDDPGEPRALAQDMLIHVTSFFRDPEAFQALKQHVLEPILKHKEDGAAIRIWVPGCSTGEETYAVAISLLESLESRATVADQRPGSLSIKLFGSDLSDEVIEAARLGLYSESALIDVSPQRLSRFFERTRVGYRIGKRVRDLCVFARHDLTCDPPFAHLDLISCRNVLIYFDAELQRRVIPLLHSCLRKPGYLFLGHSEAITGRPDLFAPLDKEHRIYLKTGESPSIVHPPATGRDVQVKPFHRAAPVRPQPARDAQRQADPLLPQRHVPAGVGVHERAPEQMRRLQDELAATKDYLQSLISEHESATDELAATNEELVAANEELQSMNEELQSAKEELQSTNEELSTLNDQLQSRNQQLDLLADDLVNVLSSVQIPVIIVDLELRVRRFTPMVREIASFIPEDVGRPIDDLKLRINVDDLTDRINEVVQALAPKQWEVQGQDGRWFRMQIRPYRTVDDRLDGAVLAFVDVDALKHALQDAEGARDYAQSIVETVPAALVVLDAGLRVVSANQAFNEQLALSPQTAAGQGLFDLGAGMLDVPVVRRALTELLTERTRFGGLEITAELPRLRRKRLSLTGRPIIWGGGAPMILLAMDDVTDLRALEAERTRLLTGATEARLEAERANSAKDLFLATLSHELRTPLGTMLMSAQILRRVATDDQRIQRASAAIERAANTQARLIDDLLDVSRIVSQKLLLDLSAVDFEAIVEGAVDLARPSAQAKSLQLELDIGDSRGAVYGDASRLQQVVTNLLTNAIKFTPHGGRVSVCLERIDGRAELTVTDTGMGIRPDVLPQLFARFVQADSAVTRTHGGLGLGLAIVRHLVEAHGGEVHAESPGEGEGATFRVTLPAGAAALAQAATTEQTAAHDIGGVRVLLIEDDDDARDAYTTMLTELGAEVQAAPSAAAGLTALEAFRPQVILSDIAMPGEDGHSFMRNVRRLAPERGGQVPAAALTALATDEDRERVMQSGFQIHVAKPIASVGLAAVVGMLAVWKPIARSEPEVSVSRQ